MRTLCTGGIVDEFMMCYAMLAITDVDDTYDDIEYVLCPFVLVFVDRVVLGCF